MFIDINAISYIFDLNIFQQDECFCSKLGMEVEYSKSNLKNITFSEMGVLSVASFCQSRAVLFPHVAQDVLVHALHSNFDEVSFKKKVLYSIGPIQH